VFTLRCNNAKMIVTTRKQCVRARNVYESEKTSIPTTHTFLHNVRLFNTMALHLTTLISRSNREVLALNYNCRLSGIISTNLPTQVGSNRGRTLIVRPE
jgi:hypothetical protein